MINKNSLTTLIKNIILIRDHFQFSAYLWDETKTNEMCIFYILTKDYKTYI